MPTTFERLTRVVRELLNPRQPRRPGDPAAPASTRRGSTQPGSPARGERARQRPASETQADGAVVERPAYPGDATGLPDTTYAPEPDGRPDPGEIVWTWVPYEEDHRRGKDRPVLIIGRESTWLVALGLTSKDHDRDEGQEREAGREWVDIGTGSWDQRGRPSEVRINRLIRVDPGAVRREGSVLPRERYDEVVAAVRRRHG